jgi:Flp pilus assembly protein TadD
MPRPAPKNYLLLALAAAALVACDIPTEPEGIHDAPMSRIGEQLQQRGDDQGAADFYLRALERKPDDLAALSNLGTILERHGNIEGAESYYAAALKQAPDDQELLHAEGRVLIRMGRTADARGIYWTILGKNPRDVKALNGLGIALDYLGQHEEAQKSYRTALDQDPNNLSSLNNLAHSYVLTGRYDEAIALLEPRAADKTATPALRQNLAEAYGFNGMYADAERLARIDLKPQDVKRNLAYYRAQRAKLAPEPKLVADLGAYPTNEMAEAKAEAARALAAGKQVTIEVKPEVQTTGGTPSFILRASGFRDAEGLNEFCKESSKNGIECKPMKKM